MSDIKKYIAESAKFSAVYGDAAEAQRVRCSALADDFAKLFGNCEGARIFSAPGRTEVGGNHTDHQRGCVLAGAVTMDDIAIAAPTADGSIKVYSKGFDTPFELNANEPAYIEAERGTTTALFRGIVKGFLNLGMKVGGFNACIDGGVLTGSGLSSSAAIEVLFAYVMNALYNDCAVDPVALAQLCKFTENEYYGKPSGLMDQMTSSVGGFVAIDFKDVKEPVVTPVQYDIAKAGYSLLIIATGGDHADLTADYAAIPAEMKAAAAVLGGELLRDCTLDAALANVAALRTNGDRSVLRALHFLLENERAQAEAKALTNGDFPEFLRLVNESGASSRQWLQNCYANKSPQSQGLMVAQLVTELFAAKRGLEAACRVHGGGFEGTVQVFMPTCAVAEYTEYMEGIFGKGAVNVLGIRAFGATEL